MGDKQPIRVARMEPRPDHAFMGCPTCHNIFHIPYEAGEPMPWCIHGGGHGYVWRAPKPPNEGRWTQMVPIVVAMEVEDD